MARSSDGRGDPTLHTAVIDDVPAMWEKLTWDIAQFYDIQRTFPDLRQPLGFAAINVCIAASSLAAWTITAFRRKRRAERRPVTVQAVREHIYAAVPQQRMCEAIANTAKHADIDRDRWLGGIVRLDFEENGVDPPGYVLRHVHENGAFQSIALSAFDAMQQCWWGELQSLGFPFSANPIGYAWQQRRIAAMLGDAHPRT